MLPAGAAAMGAESRKTVSSKIGTKGVAAELADGGEREIFVPRAAASPNPR